MSSQTSIAGAAVSDQIDGQNSALSQIERQIERGSFFMHTALGENSARLSEVESFTYGLVDVLLAKGVLSNEEIGSAITQVREEIACRGEAIGGEVVLRAEEPAEAKSESVKVDCSARLHLCQAACCKLDFALSIPEIEAGNIKWDLGRPYFIRHEADSYCSHINKEKGCCRIYDDRPATCRSYSCANDQRIWKDFEKMELNEKWLAENLSATRPRALRVLMHNVGRIES